MKKFFLDSNVYDELLKHSELFGLVRKAKTKGVAEFIGTHLEVDELGMTIKGNPEKGFLLLSIHLELQVRNVMTEGFVLERSRLDGAKLFENRDVPEFIKMTNDNPEHAEDVLMIFTAKRENAIFVTQESKRIPRLCAEIGIECINAQALGEWCNRSLA